MMPQSRPERRHIAILSPLQRKPGRTQGGLEVVVTHIANALSQKGLQVDILVMPPKGGDPIPPDLDERIEIINLKSKHKLIGLFTLVDYLRSRQPDLLLAAGHRSNMLALRAKRLLPRPPCVILGVHNMLSRQMSQFNPLKRWLRSRTISRYYPRSDAVIAVSHGVAEDLGQRFGLPQNLIHTIHNPVVTDELFRLAEQSPEHPWFHDSGPPVILSVGRLRPQKDFTTLIKAFHIVRQQRDCRLLILGEGRERPTLETLVNDLGLQLEIQLPGFIANPLPCMKQAALFVLSSAWEGFGNVLVEALSTGVAVVSTDCPSGPREILEDGRLGALVPVGDANALATAMLETLETPPDRDLLIESARRFSVERASTAYMDLLTKCHTTQIDTGTANG
ncbi:MAG TPA: glycosyltransferase [Gammaproteobacteria bacterium]|nr:glycosyltransferase [Gammaproteobacteria bacterium]